MRERLGHLQRLTSALGDAMTVDEVAHTALTEALHIDGMVRIGIAVSQGGGRQLTFASTDRDQLNVVGVRWCLIDGLDDVPLAQSVRDGRPVFLPDLDALAAAYPDLLERQRSLGTRSLASVPLLANGDRLGGLLLAYDKEQVFSDDETAFLSAFAAQVAQALRRALAYETQHSTAEQLQRSLMPNSLPELEGLALGSHYQPGGLNVDVGGDWYDVLALDDGSAVISLGDVMGKGVPAAIVMSQVRAALRAYALLDASPSLILERLDNLVTSLAAPEQIVTLLCGVIDPERRTMRLAIAGHPPPLLVPWSGRPVVLGGEIGPALGLGAGLGAELGAWSGGESGAGSGGGFGHAVGYTASTWPERVVDLSTDTTVLFYSNGLVESRDVDLFSGLDRLCDHITELGPRRREPREMCARLSDLMWRENTDDDVTMLATAVSTPERLSATEHLPADSTAPGHARRFVADRLRAWSVEDDVVAVAQLCASELVTNAVIHSGTEPRITMRVSSGHLLVLVSDQGGHGAVQYDEDYDPMSVSGRGLTLVDALATTWRAEHNADGTTVWFELDLAASGAGAAADDRTPVRH